MKVEFYGSFYTAEPHIIGEYEQKFIEKLKQEILATSAYESNLIINLTWLEPNDPNVISWLNRNAIPKSTKLYVVGLVDGMHWFTQTKTFHDLQEMKSIMEFIGFSPNNWRSFIPSLMNQYSVEELALDNDPTYAYLAYNRKSRPHRYTITKLLIDNNLIDRGYITFQKGNFDIIDQRTGETDQHLHTSDLRYSRPEDLFTLGNMDIWKKTYSVLVSETEATDPWQLSEKTWKPILGLRPFVHNGNEQLYKVLHKLNLYTPADLFKNTRLNNSDPITLIEHFKWLNQKSPKELHELYCEQYFMLKHNRNIFLELASKEKL